MNALTRGGSVGRICLLAALAASCGSDDEPGSVHVTVTTTGTSLDADGYSVTVAGTTKDVTVNGQATLDHFTPGRYSVALSDVAANCTVTSANPVTVDLESGAEAGAAFEVDCASPGVVRVHVTTTGWDYDKDGYLVDVEGATPQRIPATGVTNLMSTRTGPLAITISEVSPDCTADPGNPASVPAPAAGEVVDAAFAFHCPTVTGGLTITLDPVFQAKLLVDGVGYVSDPGGRLTVDRLTPGVHAVEYSSDYFGFGCTVDGPNPYLATVVLNVMTQITMPHLDCSNGGFSRFHP